MHTDIRMRKKKLMSIQKLKTKPQTVEVIQFDGINGAEIVEFLRSNDYTARNGGRYVSYWIGGQGSKNTVRKGDVLVAWSEGLVKVWHKDAVLEKFTIPKGFQFAV